MDTPAIESSGNGVFSVGKRSGGHRDTELWGGFRLGEWRVEPEIHRISRSARLPDDDESARSSIPTGDLEHTDLEPKVMDLLVGLAQRFPRPATKEELVDLIWGDAHIAEGALKHLIWQLRRDLGDDANRPRYIGTVHRRGYRLLEKPRPLEAPAGVSPKTSDRPTASSQRAIGAKWKPTLVIAMVILALLVFLVWFVRPPRDGIGAVADGRPAAGADRGPALAFPLTSFPGNEIDPAVSPSGDRVIYSWDGGQDRDEESAPEQGFDLWSLTTGDDEPRRLTSAPGDEVRPAVSPDGSTVAFLGHDGGSGEWGIYAVPVSSAGSRAHPSLDPAGSAADLQRVAGAEIGRPQNLSWSPDGIWLAVSTQLPGARAYRIVLVSYVGAVLRPVTDPGPIALGDLDPVFSPDGGRLAFRRILGIGSEDLFVLDLDPGWLQPQLDDRISPSLPRLGEPRRVTFDRTGILGVTWTADGRSLVFSSDRVPPRGLWRVPVDGGAPHWLGMPGTFVADPAIPWAGEGLVYQVMHCDSNIWAVDLDRGRSRGDRRRLFVSTREEQLPRYSPDGSRIAFLSNRSGHSEIWIAGADGTEARRITHLEGASIHSFSWSPDGARLAFDARLGQRAEIFITRAIGGGVERFTPENRESGQFDEMSPSWSADGRWIYFSSPRDGDWQIWKRGAPGISRMERARRVTRNGGIVAREGPEGRYVYYSRRGEPGLWRRPVNGDVEERILEHLSSADGLNWEPAPAGLFFVERRLDAPSRIARYDYETGQITAVVSLEAHRPYPPGLTVAPDGSRLFWVRLDRAESDLLWADRIP